MSIGTLTAARSAVIGGGAAVAAGAAATAATGGDDAGGVRRLAGPAGAAAVGVAALVAGRGRAGLVGSALRAAGAGALLGAAGAALIGTVGGRPHTPGASTTPSPAPVPSRPTRPEPAPASATPEPVDPDPDPPADIADPAPATPTPSPPAPAPVQPPLAAEPSREPQPGPPVQPAPQPQPATPAPAPAPLLKVGSTGPAVVALQSRLAELDYAVDTGGTYTNVTRDAVMAFQKVNGLARDGVAGPQTQAALEHPRQPELGPGAPNRIDVDLSSQTLVVVRDGRIDYIVNATSGDPNHPDGKGIATPKGTFSVERKIEGTRHAPLGDLYYPSYFRGGVAVHGSNSIVAERASHGCVRVPRWIEQRIFGDMPVGSQVVVHD